MSVLRRPSSSNDVLQQWRRKRAEEAGHRQATTTTLSPTDRVTSDDRTGGWLDQFGNFFFGTDLPSPAPTRMDHPLYPTTTPTPTHLAWGDLLFNVPPSSSSSPHRRLRSSMPGAAIPTTPKIRKHRSHPHDNVSQHPIDPRHSSELLARKQKIVKYKREREHRRTSKQEQSKMMINSEWPDELRKTHPANDRQYHYYTNDDDGDNNHQGNVDDQDDDYIYVRLRKSELQWDKGPSPAYPSSLRQTHTVHDNSKVDNFQALLKTPQADVLHRESIQRPRTAATERRGDPAVDLTPALHDLGCGFGPLPTSSPSRPQQAQSSINVSSVASNSLANSSDVERDLSELRIRVAQMRERRQHSVDQKRERTTKKKLTKQIVPPSKRTSGSGTSSHPHVSRLSLWERLDKLEAEIQVYKTSQPQSLEARFDELRKGLNDDNYARQHDGQEHSLQSDHALHQRLERLEREIMAVKNIPSSKRLQGTAPRRYAPSHVLGSSNPSSHSSALNSWASYGTTYMDGLNSDFARMMRLGGEHHYGPNDFGDHHDSDEDPTHQLKDSLARAQETYKDKSALQNETSRSIRSIRHTIHKNSAYKDEMFERESRDGRASLRRRAEGRREKEEEEEETNPYAIATTRNKAGAPPAYMVKEIVPQMAPEGRRCSDILVALPRPEMKKNLSVKKKSSRGVAPSAIGGAATITRDTMADPPTTYIYADRYAVAEAYDDVKRYA